MKSPKSFFNTLLVLILISTIGVFAGCLVYWMSLNSLSKKVSEKEVQIANFAEKERALDSLLKNYEDVKSEIDEIEYAIPNEKEAASLLVSVENLAISKGLVVTTYKHKIGVKKKKSARAQATEAVEGTENDASNPRMYQVERDGGLLRFSPEMTIKGSYAKILEFLEETENLNRLLVVDKININKEADPTSPGAPDYVKAVIAVYAYFK